MVGDAGTGTWAGGRYVCMCVCTSHIYVRLANSVRYRHAEPQGGVQVNSGQRGGSRRIDAFAHRISMYKSQS